MSVADWRPMRRDDLDAVVAIADRVHPDYPEDAAVFAERLALCPPGCQVLWRGETAVGYVLSHPWPARRPPRLNGRLGSIPPEVGTWYIHDLALLEAARGSGAGQAIVAALAAQARRRGLPSLSGVAVGASLGFWRRLGFDVIDDDGLAELLNSYGTGARFIERVRRLPSPL